MTKPAWLERYNYYQSIGFREGVKKWDDMIVSWMQRYGKWVKTSKTPWCGGGAAHMLIECGLEQYVPDEPLAAVNWLNLPTKLDGPREGAFAIFKRDGGHHVTCIDHFDNEYLYCVGCNQRDSVCTLKYRRSAVLGYRWPVPLVDATALAKTSRIAAASEQQKSDQAKGGALLSTSPAPEVLPPAPAGWRDGVDAWLGEVSWVKTLFNYGADFGGFVGAHWPYIAVTVAAFFFGRSWWNSHKISKARVEDANLGWTT